MKQKLLSRKFLVALTGIVSGIVLILNGECTEGVSAMIASILGYLVAEGYVDAMAVKATVDALDEKIESEF